MRVCKTAGLGCLVCIVQVVAVGLLNLLIMYVHAQLVGYVKFFVYNEPLPRPYIQGFVIRT